ncbi:MAG: hypothetical protein ABW221_07600 [Vicinamibacteria bacterium]
MFRHPLIHVFVLLSGAGLAGGQQLAPEKQQGMLSTATPGLVLESPHVTFGDAFELSTVSHTFHFSNRGPRDVVIESGLGLKPGAEVTFKPARVVPGASGTIEVKQRLEDARGESSFRFAVITDEPGVARYRMSLTGFVMSAYSPELSLLSFGRTQRGQTPEKSVEVFSREVDRLEVTRVEGVPDFLDVTASERAGLAGEGLVVRARLRERPPLGLSTGRFTLVTNVAAQPQLVVHYSAEVFADVLPDVHPLSFELVRMGEPKTIDVRLRSRSGNAFEVKEVKDSLGVVDVESEPCTEGAGPSDCVVLHATVLVLGPLSLQGALRITLTGETEPLSLTYGGHVIAPHTQIRTLGESEATFAEPQPAAAERRVELRAPAAAPTLPAPPPSLPAAATAAPRLNWKAQNDEAFYGFVVYRADKEIGPFRRVSSVIRSQTDAGVTHQYEFTDPTARPGRTYYYYLDTIDRRGQTQRFSPVRARTVAPAR